MRSKEPRNPCTLSIMICIQATLLPAHKPYMNTHQRRTKFYLLILI